MSNPSSVLTEKLYPMAVANYLAKLPEMQTVDQHSINQELLDDSIEFSDRLLSIMRFIGSEAVKETIVQETNILLLTISDREDDIQDGDRRAYFAKSDATQVAHRESAHDLIWFMGNGLEVRPMPGATNIMNNKIEAGHTPLIEKYKAARLLNINGFDNSRAMHLIHDVIDHPWLFTALDGAGIFDKYADFLDSVDLTSNSFLYSRQAELVASVGFGSRRWELVKNRGDSFILDPQDIVALLGASDDERCIQATNLFRGSERVRDQAQFVIENMAVQIADERRRYGAVKMHDRYGGIRPMPLLDSLYLAFLIDSVDALQKNEEYDKAQTQVVCTVEEVLEEIRDSDKTNETAINVSPARIGTNFYTSISPEKIEWITTNKSQLTTYTNISAEEK